MERVLNVVSSTSSYIRNMNVSQSIRLRSDSIDCSLQGGMRCGLITELFGESGSGKTQICLQLALNVQLPPQLGGLYGVAIYYYYDYTFPTRRLEKMRDALHLKLLVGNDTVNLDNIILCKVQDCRELSYRLKELEKECSDRSDTDKHVRLVVIDSIASLCRSQFVNTKEGMAKRKWFFKTISSQLSRHARHFNLAVVITNQVSNVVGAAPTHLSSEDEFISMYGHRILPSLGTSWTSCVHNRIFLGIKVPSEGEDKERNPKRRMKIVISPYLRKSECAFEITKEGVV